MKQGRNQVRIIAGKWRGLKIDFPTANGLRPTPDRVRETLFNWLQPWLPGTRCLDLFAGSGALGLEALSRGAQSMVLVEQDASVVRSLINTVEHLNAESVDVVRNDGLRYLGQAHGPFDIVFLDPPFGQALLGQCCQLIIQNNIVKPGGFVYAEANKGESIPLSSPQWAPLRSKQAGQVGYHLIQRIDGQ
ncbi:MAG TPA: 16S rRNA (guanine(966)-N(2))-methyltransferase RsmD [Acidiferrobacteraceae bacterium]|nr:16S rRNA (guanine(966)-N(2))-methyltransferase RsmD [Acidiferrobacteraceae bacterium]